MDAASPLFVRSSAQGAAPGRHAAAHFRRALSQPILAAPPVRPRRSVGGFQRFFLRVTDRKKSLTKTAQPIPLEFGAKTKMSFCISIGALSIISENFT